MATGFLIGARELANALKANFTLRLDLTTVFGPTERLRVALVANDTDEVVLEDFVDLPFKEA